MIRRRILRLGVTCAVLALTGLAGASAVASTSAPAVPPLTGLPAGQVLLIGAVAHPEILTVAKLQALPPHTETVTFKAGSGSETHTFTGPLLLDVLAQAGPQFDPTIKNDKLRYYVSVGATDNYRALVAYGEIDPGFENKEVLLATSQDGQSLATTGPRLVVPGDISGGRYVTNVNRVFFEKSPL
jgi:Oxidoreductase molybdopterin binding domain